MDFIETLGRLYHEDWKSLSRRFGLFGDKRRNTTSTYLETGLMYTRIKPYSTLAPFTRYSEGRFTDYRKATDQERKTFGSPMIVVFRKREKQEDNSKFAGRARQKQIQNTYKQTRLSVV